MPPAYDLNNKIQQFPLLSVAGSAYINENGSCGNYGYILASNLDTSVPLTRRK